MEKRINIIGVEIEIIENPGCNNGNYPKWAGTNTYTGHKVSGKTCNCLCGCSGTDRLENYDYIKRTATVVFEV